MRKSLAAAYGVASVLALLSGSPAFAAASSPLTITQFDSGSGIPASEAEVQSTWTALQAQGTTAYVGGQIGNFKIDESSLIAGALAIGVSELDNFLKTGTLSVSASGLGSLLSTAMSGAAGIDLSYLTNSFTAGGGALGGLPFTTAGSLTSSSGGAVAEGQCDSSIANKQVAVGLKGVQNVVDAATSSNYGFSQNSSIGAGATSTGFAARSCLDKLFQNAGSDVLFKPPSLASLTTMLQGWTCNAAKSVMDQVTGQLGDMSTFNTAAMGGFFPSAVFGEANDAKFPIQPGIGNSLTDVFGNTFSEKVGGITTTTSLTKLFN